MIGERLKKLRNEKNLTQEEIAKIFQMSRSTYAQYEADRRNPDYEVLKMFAEYFEVTTDYILGRSPFPADLLKEKGIEYIELCEEIDRKGISPERAREIINDVDKILEKYRK